MISFGSQDRESMRQAWRTAWERRQQGLPLEPLQLQLADLVAEHPEYHELLAAPAGVAPSSAAPEAEAYLHLALHLALREQVSTDRPHGIAGVHGRLSRRAGAAHAAEHRMIEVLGRILWDAQRASRAPDERQYLEELLRL